MAPRVLGIGCGGIGGYVGGMLSRAGNAEVALVDIWPEHMISSQ
jgi:ketopantoate reductase